jgi:uncharacterized protein YbjT (DUF2867 family)
MKIFVAGGTGAIGRPLLDQLLAKGHNVVALTRSQERAQSFAAGNRTCDRPIRLG